MANSLRAQITHLFKKGKITRPEYDWFMKKAYGHDQTIKALAFQEGVNHIIDEIEEICGDLENCHIDHTENDCGEWLTFTVDYDKWADIFIKLRKLGSKK